MYVHVLHVCMCVRESKLCVYVLALYPGLPRLLSPHAAGRLGTRLCMCMCVSVLRVCVRVCISCGECDNIFL